MGRNLLPRNASLPAERSSAKLLNVIPIAKPVIGEAEIDAVTAVLKSGIITQGKKVEEFEEAFARFIGTKYAVAVNSGTAALHISLLAHGIGRGDEVITSPFTFIASANSILFTGARPVFADIEQDTFNVDPEKIEQLLRSEARPKSESKSESKITAILPVHLYGQPCDMKRITQIAHEHGLIIIEDACQAHGAEYEGKKAGSFGTGCFSFYPTKNMTTGEGGMITTNDDDIARKARMIRSHGQKERYFHEILGYNYRMTDIAAAIGLYQLGKLENFNDKRIGNARLLTESLRRITGLITPYVRPNTKHVFHQYTVRITGDFPISRDELRKKLLQKGIATEVYYPLPVHRQPLYQGLGYTDRLPNGEKAAAEVLSLPVHPSLTKEDLENVVRAIQDI